MKIEARPVYLGNSFTVWIGNYRLLFQGAEDEAERIAAELGVRQGWKRYIGPCVAMIGLCGFGESAPTGVLLKHFGFTVENVVTAAKKLCAK